LAWEVRDFPLQGLHLQDGFFALFLPQPCPPGVSLLVFPSVILRQFCLFPHWPGVKAWVHLFPLVVVAIVVKTMFSARDLPISPWGSSPWWLLWGPVLSEVHFHLLSPVVIVGGACLSRSPGELGVPAWRLFFAEFYVTFVVVAVHPTHGGMCHLLSS